MAPRRRGRAKNILEATANVVGASVILLLLWPVLLAVAVAVWLDDRGPILFQQQRIGRYGRPFGIYKFRTMRTGAELELADLVAQSGEEMGAFVKISRDPRITRVGRILRATSLDELPQLLNVLRREMNLVGPRPQIQAEVDTYHEVHWRRLLVPPGMTGLWQVSGRSSLTPEESLELDSAYVRQRSARLDASLLLRTVPVVVTRRGAQ